MCDNAADNYSDALGALPNCYNTQNMCDKAVSTYPSAIQFVANLHKTHEVCDKAIDTCPFVFGSVPDRCMKKLCF